MNSRENTLKYSSTMMGMTGLLCWSLTSCMALALSNIPPFEFVLILSVMNFVISSIRLTVKKTWHTLRQPITFWIIGPICVPFNLLGYFASFRFIEPSLADLIYYLYPVHVIWLSSIILRKRITLKGILSPFLGFLGVCFLLAFDIDVTAQDSVLVGVLFAFLGSISWATFAISSRIYKDAAYEMVGIFFGIGSIFALICHLCCETFVFPNFTEFFVMFLWAVIIQGLAITLWERGLKYGQFELINMFSFSVPVCSVMLLISLGYVVFTLKIAIAVLFVATGLILCQLEERKARQNVTA